MKNKNIILLSIIFILLLTLSVYVYVNYQDKTKISVLSSQSGNVFSSQKECERETGEECRFQNCDLDCPEGFKKGWTAPISKGASCGLSVSNISRNQKVSFPLEIKGLVDNTVNCDSKWTMFEGQAGIVELYFNHDGGWKQVTNGIPVPVSEWMTDKTDFSVVLNFNNGGIGLPDGTEMKVVFKEEDPSGKGEGDIFELPVVLENTSASDTSNWKTYKNEKYGFEFKYPKIWKIEELGKQDLVFAKWQDLNDNSCQLKFESNYALFKKYSENYREQDHTSEYTKIIISGKEFGLYEYRYKGEISSISIDNFTDTTARLVLDNYGSNQLSNPCISNFKKLINTIKFTN